ncbi:PSP1 C-terminal conserved region-domain-containing protein [Chlamydoabsidia padenii]|nr:PSP1 C-terminal conserved region-domain-containing protein [Chlamydoabsidia padenii]
MEHIDAYFSGATTNNQDDLHNNKTTFVYVVRFKNNRTELCYLMQKGIQPHIGDWVIVEADRGQDLGKVISKKNKTTTTTDKDAMKQLYRLATLGEVESLVTQQHDEEEALVACQAKIHQWNLPMQVINAEYQWDRRKLTFYFMADHRIDFREVVRELFKTYKTRIWMCALKSGVESPL